VVLPELLTALLDAPLPVPLPALLELLFSLFESSSKALADALRSPARLFAVTSLLSATGVTISYNALLLIINSSE